MTDTSFDLKEITQQYLEGKFPQPVFFRCLMYYPNWHLPTKTDETGEPQLLAFVDEAGERWLKVFTDPEAIEAFVAAENVEFEDNWIIASGHTFFGILEDDLAGIEINPHHQSSLLYPQDTIPKLKQWARSARIEDVLNTIDVAETPLGFLKDFDGYIVVLRKFGDRVELALAPDSQGRLLAAVFTAEDTLEAFLIDLVPNSEEFELIPIRLNGTQLFSQLREMKVDGMVFNCSGPIPPRAFDIKLTDYILSAEE